MDHPILFWGAALAATVGALAAVISRVTLYSALGLAVALLSTALLFLGLHAPAAATFQVMVYTGAILVLLLFVIMLLNLGTAPPLPAVRPAFTASTLLLGGLFLAFLSKPLWGGPSTPMPGTEAVSSRFGSLESLGQALFAGGNVYLMEILSLLLLAAIVGALALARHAENDDAR